MNSQESFNTQGYANNESEKSNAEKEAAIRELKEYSIRLKDTLFDELITKKLGYNPNERKHDNNGKMYKNAWNQNGDIVAFFDDSLEEFVTQYEPTILKKLELAGFTKNESIGVPHIHELVLAEKENLGFKSSVFQQAWDEISKRALKERENMESTSD